MAEATRESMGFDLDGFYSVQVVKQIRMTWTASENTQGFLCWVHLKQCGVLPLETEMKIDLPLSAGFITAGTYTCQVQGVVLKLFY